MRFSFSRNRLVVIVLVVVVALVIAQLLFVSARTKNYPTEAKGATEAKLGSFQAAEDVVITEESVEEGVPEEETTVNQEVQDLLGSLPAQVLSLPAGYSPQKINSGEDKYCEVRELFTPEEVTDALSDVKNSLTKMAARDTCNKYTGTYSGFSILDAGYYTCALDEERTCTDYFLTTTFDVNSPYAAPQYAKRVVQCHVAQVFAKQIPSKTVFYFKGYVKNKLILKIQGRTLSYEYDGALVKKGSKLPYAHQAYFFDDGIPADGKSLKFVKILGGCADSTTNPLRIIEQPSAANQYTTRVQVTSVGTGKKLCNKPGLYTFTIERA